MNKKPVKILLIILLIILFKSYSINAQEITSELKEKIAFIEKVGKFGESVLGIKPNNMYSNFTGSVDNNKTTYLLYWCPKTTIHRNRDNMGALWGDKIKTKDGFILNMSRRREPDEKHSAFIPWEMTQKEVQAFKSALLEKFDIFEREIIAHSSIKELTPAFLEMEMHKQVELVFHEGIHNMIDNLNLKELDNLNIFEEAIATIVGLKGTLLFLSNEVGIESKEYKKAKTRNRKYIKQVILINKIYKRLSDLYSSPRRKKEKLKLRELVLEKMNTPSMKQILGIEKPRTRKAWEIFHETKVNNAYIAYYHTYTAHAPLVMKVWDKINNPKKFIELIKKPLLLQKKKQ
jgi:hypothetical protein